MEARFPFGFHTSKNEGGLANLPHGEGNPGGFFEVGPSLFYANGTDLEVLF